MKNGEQAPHHQEIPDSEASPFLLSKKEKAPSANKNENEKMELKKALQTLLEAKENELKFLDTSSEIEKIKNQIEEIKERLKEL